MTGMRELEKTLLLIMGISIVISIFGKFYFPQYYLWPDWVLQATIVMWVIGSIKLAGTYAVSFWRKTTKSIKDIDVPDGIRELPFHKQIVVLTVTMFIALVMLIARRDKEIFEIQEDGQ